mmetsp:Transcript_8270/g.17242  ORF Transcript_8270/g.17242 Transcript_8270/m.17242 type:complete len:211 (+) Transcript_8270:602-1234(+)
MRGLPGEGLLDDSRKCRLDLIFCSTTASPTLPLEDRAACLLSTDLKADVLEWLVATSNCVFARGDGLLLVTPLITASATPGARYICSSEITPQSNLFSRSIALHLSFQPSVARCEGSARAAAFSLQACRNEGASRGEELTSLASVLLNRTRRLVCSASYLIRLSYLLCLLLGFPPKSSSSCLISVGIVLLAVAKKRNNKARLQKDFETEY